MKNVIKPIFGEESASCAAICEGEGLADRISDLFQTYDT
jgi:hypothetical protein